MLIKKKTLCQCVKITLTKIGLFLLQFEILQKPIFEIIQVFRINCIDFFLGSLKKWAACGWFKGTRIKISGVPWLMGRWSELTLNRDRVQHLPRLWSPSRLGELFPCRLFHLSFSSSSAGVKNLSTLAIIAIRSTRDIEPRRPRALK